MCEGNIVYQGAAKSSVDYFNKLGYSRGKMENPADAAMRYLNVNYPKQPQDEMRI